MSANPYWVALLQDGTSISQISKDGSLVLSSTLIGLAVSKIEVHGLSQTACIPIPPDSLIKVFNNVRMTVKDGVITTTKNRHFGYESPSQGSLYAVVNLQDGSLYYESSYP